MEVHLHYKILPDAAKISKNVCVFTDEEKAIDLQENSKYFKQNNKQIKSDSEDGYKTRQMTRHRKSRQWFEWKMKLTPI